MSEYCSTSSIFGQPGIVLMIFHDSWFQHSTVELVPSWVPYLYHKAWCLSSAEVFPLILPWNAWSNRSYQPYSPNFVVFSIRCCWESLFIAPWPPCLWEFESPNSSLLGAFSWQVFCGIQHIMHVAPLKLSNNMAAWVCQQATPQFTHFSKRKTSVVPLKFISTIARFGGISQFQTQKNPGTNRATPRPSRWLWSEGKEGTDSMEPARWRPWVIEDFLPGNHLSVDTSWSQYLLAYASMIIHAHTM